MRAFLGLLLCAAAALPYVHAQEYDDVVDEADYYVPAHPLTDMPGSPEGISTAFVFPGQEESEYSFPIGEMIPVVFSMRNGMDVAINITNAMGSLNSPFDFATHLYNFSSTDYGLVIGPNDEISLNYKFPAVKNLEPTEYAVALTVFFETDDEYFSNTFFNQTVGFHDAGSDFEVRQLFPLILLVAIVFLMTFFMTDKFDGRASTSPSSRSAEEDAKEWAMVDKPNAPRKRSVRK